MPTSQRPGAEAPEDSLAEEIESPADIASQHDETSLTRRSRRAPHAASAARCRGRAARVSSARRPAATQGAPAAQPRHPDHGRRPRRHRRPPRLRRVALARRGRCDPAAGRRRRRAVARRRLRRHAPNSSSAAATRPRRPKRSTRRRPKRPPPPCRAASGRARPRRRAAASSPDEPLDDGARLRRGALAASRTSRYASYNLFRPSNRPNHNGVDMLSPAGTPIFAAAAGVVRVSQESYGGYGVAVTIDSRRRRPDGLDPLRSHDLRQPSGRRRGRPSRPASSSASSAAPAARRPTTCTSRSTSTAARRPARVAPGQRRLSLTSAEPSEATGRCEHPFSDTPPRVHLPRRPSSSARALA